MDSKRYEGPDRLETERLLLRRLAPEDAEELHAIYSDPEVMRFFDGTRSLEETREEIAEVIRGFDQTGVDFMATIHKADGKLIGRCGLLWQVIDDRQEVEVAYMLDRPYWGRGLGTEAAQALKAHGFRQFDFPRLISLIHPLNVASIRVAEKNGMTYEREIEFCGHPCRLYAVERSEFLKADLTR